MVTKNMDKYAGYKYELSKTEMEEAKWLIEQGDFKDLDEFIESSRQAEIRMLKRADATKKRKATVRKNKHAEAAEKQKAA